MCSEGGVRKPPRWLVEYGRRVHHVRAALAYTGGTHDEVDIAAGIEAGRFQMWCAPDSIAITELTTYPKSKDCHVFLAGGHLPELEILTAEIEKWAKEQGCSRVTLAGRRGWTRTFLTERGYTPRWVVMAKDLEGTNGEGRRNADDNTDDGIQDTGLGI
jgi:hypothetical protein